VIVVVIDQQFIQLKWKNRLIDPLKGYVFRRCFFIHKKFNFIISVYFSNCQHKIWSRLANFTTENLRIQKNSLCGTTLDLHYNTRILAGDHPTSRNNLVAPISQLMDGPFELLAFESLMPEILMIFAIFVHVSEIGQSFDGLWAPWHGVALDFHEDLLGPGVKTSIPLLVLPWVLVW